MAGKVNWNGVVFYCRFHRMCVERLFFKMKSIEMSAKTWNPIYEKDFGISIHPYKSFSRWENVLSLAPLRSDDNNFFG